MAGVCDKCTYRKSQLEDDHRIPGREAVMEAVGEEEEEYDMVEDCGEDCGGELCCSDQDEDMDSLGLFHRVAF